MFDVLSAPYPGVIKAVFLDRDGVLNEKMPEGHYVKRWSEFHVLPGVEEAIGLLNRAELRVVVISNQRGIALGKYTAEDVQAIHAEFQKLLETEKARVDGFYFCPHDDKECNCRKPMPGLFEQAVKDFPEIDAASCVMIGDSISDIEFGRRLGMFTVFIEGDPRRQKLGFDSARALADKRFFSLYEAVIDLLATLLARKRSIESISGGPRLQPS
jgi:D-glycero-D-manno-heptose 1,7-bisphosphate phosphatase